MIPWILVGGAIIAGGLLLSDSDDKKFHCTTSKRVIPESEVPADIRRKLNRNCQFNDAPLEVRPVSESEIPPDILRRLKNKRA